MKKSLAVQWQNGNLNPLSAQVVALHSIQIDGILLEQTVKSLTALLISFLRETLSSDKVYFAIVHAKRLSLENGVSEEEFNRVAKIVFNDWNKNKDLNPLSGMF